MRCLGDDQPILHAYDAPRFAQHDLDLARVLIPPLAKLGRQRRRRDRAQVDDPTLGLGDDLVGDDNNIASLESFP
jgi:hypothetical protein